MNWEGKVAVVTGGAKGIGGATAELFAQQGAKVLIFDLDPAAEAQVAAIEAAGGTATWVRGSVASEDDVKALGEAAVAAFGRIDVLVNNAGIMLRHENAKDWTIADVRKVGAELAPGRAAHGAVRGSVHGATQSPPLTSSAAPVTSLA